MLLLLLMGGLVAWCERLWLLRGWCLLVMLLLLVRGVVGVVLRLLLNWGCRPSTLAGLGWVAMGAVRRLRADTKLLGLLLMLAPVLWIVTVIVHFGSNV